MRRHGDVADALSGETPGVGQGCGLIGCSVVDAREQMEVQIYV
jgi:hypothetical protein